MSERRVMVGTDGSPTSYRAVRRAAEIARDLGGPLTIVRAVGPGEPPTRVTDREGGEGLGYVEVPEDLMAEARAIAEEVGVSMATAVAVEGDPARVLVGLAEEQGVEVIVVGNQGMNSIAGRLLGSVPTLVAQRAPCDVLIVRTTDN
jgi:nucleotide-binding universal stress UspA family protein